MDTPIIPVTATKFRKIPYTNRFGTPITRLQVLYYTDRWHEDVTTCMDREQANRRVEYIKSLYNV